MPKIDINCDMGESTTLHPYDIEQDLALLNFVSSINIACGYHAGNSRTMHILVQAALERKIAVGAHPSYPDRENFGRLDMHFPPTHIYDMMIYQMSALQGFLSLYGATMHHVKPHGALYNMAVDNEVIADAICSAVRDFNKSVIIYTLPSGILNSMAKSMGLRVAREAFADRSYQADGTLTPRKNPDALLKDPADAVSQVLQIVNDNTVTLRDGSIIPVEAETICIHSDGESALAIAETIHTQLKSKNVHIQHP
jgi:UPF0271 protein